MLDAGLSILRVLREFFVFSVIPMILTVDPCKRCQAEKFLASLRETRMWKTSMLF